jgi:DNA-binding NarL/FixJ family response regulator
MVTAKNCLLVGANGSFRIRIEKLVAQHFPEVPVYAETSFPNAHERIALNDRAVEYVVVVYLRGHTTLGLKFIEDTLGLPGVFSILACTAHRLTAQHALQLGAKVCITLPTDDDALVLAIRHLLRGDVYVSSALVPPITRPGVRLNGWLSAALPANLGDHRAASPTEYLRVLTTRERQIVQLLRLGLASKEIASMLDISPWTVSTHVKNLYKKLGVTSRSHLRRLL